MKVITILALFLALLGVFGVYLFSVVDPLSSARLSETEARESALSFLSAFDGYYGVFLSPEEESALRVDISSSGEAVVQINPSDTRLVPVIEKHSLTEIRASQVTFVNAKPLLTVQGARNGFFFGVLPVRVPTDVVVAERSSAFVERPVSPWWALFVRF